MLGASFLPARFRAGDTNGEAARPGYLNRQLSPLLQALSRPAALHPLRTIVFILVLASSSYIGLLEGSLFESANKGAVTGPIDLPLLVDGGRQLKMGEDTGWKWQADSQPIDAVDEVGHEYHARSLN